VRELLQAHPPRRVQTEQGELVQGLTVRLSVQRAQACGEVDLGDAARFYPSDEALSVWRRDAHEGQVSIVYE
jgi:DNA polymerase III subunit alpha